MDIKKMKLEKKISLTDTVNSILNLEVDQIDKVKDNTLLLKVALNGQTVYYKVVISEVMKNVDEWLDLVKDYKEKKSIKKN